jgi:hypothetical protein
MAIIKKYGELIALSHVVAQTALENAHLVEKPCVTIKQLKIAYTIGTIAEYDTQAICLREIDNQLISIGKSEAAEDARLKQLVLEKNVNIDLIEKQGIVDGREKRNDKEMVVLNFIFLGIDFVF